MKITQNQFELRVMNASADILHIGEYSGAHKPVTVGCANNHFWQVIPNNLFNRGNGATCRECNNLQKYVDWDSLRDKVIDLKILEGLSNQEIATKLGVSVGSLEAYLHREGVKLEGIKFNRVVNKIEQTCKELGYTFNLEEAKSSHDKFSFTCDKGHVNTMLIKNFLNKEYRCPKCSTSGISRAEKEVVEYIKSIYSGTIEENNREYIKPKELDIVLPELGIAIEYSGNYWHSGENQDKLEKLLLCNEVGIQLINIDEDEWITNKNIVKSRIGNLLGVNRRIFARKCLLREISYPKEFLHNNHIQGSGSITSINYGLFYEDELVAVMTFSKNRFGGSADWELVRYCSKTGVNVVGGASRLLKQFRVEHKGSIVSYADLRWSNGNLYRVLGFSFSHNSAPNYKYFKGNTILSRYKCQKHKLPKLLGDKYNPKLTEKENMFNAGYNIVYDCGNSVWVMK